MNKKITILSLVAMLFVAISFVSAEDACPETQCGLPCMPSGLVNGESVSLPYIDTALATPWTEAPKNWNVMTTHVSEDGEGIVFTYPTSDIFFVEGRGIVSTFVVEPDMAYKLNAMVVPAIIVPEGVTKITLEFDYSVYKEDHADEFQIHYLISTGLTDRLSGCFLRDQVLGGLTKFDEYEFTTQGNYKNIKFELEVPEFRPEDNRLLNLAMFPGGLPASFLFDEFSIKNVKVYDSENPPTSVKNTIVNESVILSRDNITITNRNAVSVTIQDISGRVISTHSVNSGSVIEKPANGVYVISVTDNQGRTGSTKWAAY